MAVNDYLKEDDIDLINIIRVILRNKVFIIVTVVLLTLLSIIFTFVYKKHESSAFFSLSSASRKMNITNYKVFSNYFLETNNFIDYLKEDKILDNSELQPTIGILEKKDNLRDFYSPVYSLSKDDKKKMLVIKPNSESYVMGVRILYKSKSKKISRAMVKSLGGFLHDCIMKNILEEFVLSNYSLYLQKKSELENSFIESNFLMQQLELKKARLIDIAKKYKGVEKANFQSIISVEQGGERFLSPKVQLVGIESSISNLKTDIAQKEREKKIVQYMLSFYSQANRHLVEHKIIGLKDLRVLLHQILDDKKLKESSDEAKFVFNQLSTKLEDFSNYSQSILKFEPELNINSKNVIDGKRKLIVGISFIFSFFLALFIVFVREFWKSNFKSSIKE